MGENSDKDNDDRNEDCLCKTFAVVIRLLWFCQDEKEKGKSNSAGSEQDYGSGRHFREVNTDDTE